MQPWAKEIPNVEWVIFEKSSHMAHWEERDKYMDVVAKFLVGDGEGTS